MAHHPYLAAGLLALRGERALDLALELVLGGEADDAVELAAAVEHDQGRDARDPVVDHGLFILVSIHFEEEHRVAIFMAELFDYGADHAAGAAPGSPEIYYYRLLRIENDLLEVAILYAG